MQNSFMDKERPRKLTEELEYKLLGALL